MIFFLDENFPKKAFTFLDFKGITVIDIRGTSKEGMSDRDIFRLCQESKAVFFNN